MGVRPFHPKWLENNTIRVTDHVVRVLVVAVTDFRFTAVFEQVLNTHHETTHEKTVMTMVMVMMFVRRLGTLGSKLMFHCVMCTWMRDRVSE